jgi:hypothetical protein
MKINGIFTSVLLASAMTGVTGAQSVAPSPVSSDKFSRVSLYNLIGVMRYCAAKAYVPASAIGDATSGVKEAEEMLSFTEDHGDLDREAKEQAMTAGADGIILDYDGEWHSIDEMAKKREVSIKEFCRITAHSIEKNK